jgi:hypothetical protein
MLRRVVLLSMVGLVGLCSTAAWGQDTAPISRAEFAKALADLRQEIQSLHAPSAPAPRAAAAPAAPSPSNVSAGTSAIGPAKEGGAIISEAPTGGSLKSSNISMESRLDALEKRLKSLEDLQEAQSGFNSQVASYIRGPAYAGAIGPAVNPPPSGQLVIRNQMHSVQQVVVNGTDMYAVAPNSTRTVKVATGSITTQIHGEKPLTWFIGAPSYTQEIVIAPAALNPLSTTTTTLYDPLTGGWYTVER